MTPPAAPHRPATGKLLFPLLITGVYLALGLRFMAAIPPFEGPDEPQHFAYVAWLARTHRLPPAGDAAYEAGIDHEASQHPLYYLMAALAVSGTDLYNPPIVYRPNPHFIGPLARNYPDNDNRAIHYEGDGRPLAGGWLAFYLARGVSLLFGALLLAAVYGLAREIWPQRITPAIQSMALAAATPQLLFLGAVVSNDAPAAALGACTMWALARLLRRGYRPRRAVLLGALFGLAILTKASALALAAPIALGLGWLWRRTPQPWPRLAQMGLLVAGAALLLSGWWFVRNWLVFGSPLGLETHAATTWAIVDPAGVELAWRRWWEVFRSFWLWFGWGTVRAADWFYLAMAGAALAAIVGLARAAWRARRRTARQTARTAMLLLAAVALLAMALLLELWMREVIAPFGRLLYPALAAAVILLVAGWRQLQRHAPWLVVAFLLSFSLAAPRLILQPAYARPPLLTAAQLEALQPGLGLHLGPTFEQAFAELLAVDVLQASAAAGSVAPVRVCWRALRQASADYSLLLQIIGPQEQRIAGRSTYPGLGSYPTSQWQPGDAFCDRVQIEIGAQAAIEPLVYQLELAMLDVQANRRLPLYDAAGNELSVAFVDRLRVYSPERVTPAPQPAAGSGAALLAHEVPQRQWRAGHSYPITLQWATFQPLPTDYQVFVHLRAPGAAAVAAQADGPPAGGWYPTSWWPVAQVVRDARQFALPADAPAGTYHLYVGLYDLAGGARITPEYDLGAIQVRP